MLPDGHDRGWRSGGSAAAGGAVGTRAPAPVLALSNRISNGLLQPRLCAKQLPESNPCWEKAGGHVGVCKAYGHFSNRGLCFDRPLARCCHVSLTVQVRGIEAPYSCRSENLAEPLLWQGPPHPFDCQLHDWQGGLQK